MSTLTLGIVVIIYMFILAWLGYIGYKQTKNASDYLLGGRKVNPVIMALSYGATFISASAIVGFGGVAATFGMGIQWLCLLNMFMGVVIAFIIFGRNTRKLGEKYNARTFPQLLGLHYNSRAIQIFIAAIIFIGMPVQMLYNFCAAVLRAVGDTKRPLYFLTIAGVINAGLNLVFVIGFKMSVAGVALATIISQAVSAALVTRSLMLMDGPTQLHLDRLAIKPHIMRMIIQIGLPAGIQSCMFSLSNVVIQSSVNSFGSIVIAGNAAGANVGNFVYQAMNTFQQAVTCFAGQNIGARKPRRVLNSMYVSLFWALSFGVVFGVLSCVFGTQLLGLYSPDPAVIQVGLNRMYIVCGPYFLCGIMDVMTGVLRGVGYSLLPMIVSLMGACVFRIFWVMTIFAANRTMDCLMISYPVSWALTFLVLVVIFAVLWKKKIRPRYTPEELAAR